MIRLEIDIENKADSNYLHIDVRPMVILDTGKKRKPINKIEVILAARFAEIMKHIVTMKADEVENFWKATFGAYDDHLR